MTGEKEILGSPFLAGEGVNRAFLLCSGCRSSQGCSCPSPAREVSNETLSPSSNAGNVPQPLG